MKIKSRLFCGTQYRRAHYPGSFSAKTPDDMSLKGVTTHSLSKGITLYANENTVKSVSSGRDKPLLFDAPLATIEAPGSGQVLAHVLQLLESEPFSTRPMVVHAFSVGGYTFAQLISHVAKDTLRYQSLIDRVKGQIYDSLVVGSLENMAVGVGKTFLPRFERMVKYTSLLYFNLLKRQTVDYFDASIEVFWNTPVTCPALYYSCDSDVMCNTEVLHNLLEHWKRRGISVTSKHWEKSVHAGHLRTHPQEYLSVLEHFLRSINMLPLTSKL
ncbi:hypothetical protein Baya_2846 [Bagarius yarrelli]|uniref:Transmembrane protein 53 n=1 Tax=Bagarius yarrelli TaxID=175774 RepID=A0A556TQT1_BAGYA|nr:hypothetical protein Baya_2846 [Bagarius yarrelli]